MHYWYVGMDAHVLVISCFIDAMESKNTSATRVLDSVSSTIDSFRKVQDA